MIEAIHSLWNEHVPAWVRVRCTDRFIGHVLLLAFVLAAALIVAEFHVSASEVLKASLLGGVFFVVTRFVLHKHSTLTTTGFAVSFVIVVEALFPWLLGWPSVSSWARLGQRLPVLGAMAVLEVLEEDSLEEEVEAIEEEKKRR